MALTSMQQQELNDETTTAASPDGGTGLMCGRGGGGGSIDDDRQPQRRTVSLSSTVKVVNIDSTLSDEQKKTMWYTREELRSLTKSRNAIRDHSRRCDQKRVHKQDGETEDNAICTDGLKTSIGSAFAGTVVRYAVHTVLNEQESQWERDIDDPVHMALIYSECCSLSQWEALETATRLAKEVHQLLQPPRSSTTTKGGGKLRKSTLLNRSVSDATGGKYSPEAAKKSSVKKITSMPSLKESSSKNKSTFPSPRSKRLSMTKLSNMSAPLYQQQEASSSSKNKSFNATETKKISMPRIRSLLSLKEASSSSSSSSFKRKPSCDSGSHKNQAIPKRNSLPSLINNKESSSSSSSSSSKFFKSPLTKVKTLQLEPRKSAAKLFSHFL